MADLFIHLFIPLCIVQCISVHANAGTYVHVVIVDLQCQFNVQNI